MLEQKPTIRISHPEWHRLASLDCSGKVELHKGELISYEEIQKEPGNTSIIFHFENEVYFNTISFQAKPGEVIYMPDVFRFEISQDGNCWESIIQEHSYSSRNSNEFISNFALIRAKKVKLLIKIKQLMRDDSYKVSFSNLHIGISGIIKIDASSENDRYWVKENLIDSRPDYGWSSKEKENPEEESLQFDLGSVNRVEELRLLTRDHADVHFPNKLFFYYSEDDLSWFQLFEELNFLSERNTWYKWRFLPTNMRFLKIVCVNETPNPDKKFYSQIVEIELYASPDVLDLSRKKNIAETPPYSSIIRSGLVRLAVDGENRAGVAVQGNDRRLRDASSEFKGIVELAVDGEDRAGVVVQGNDKRLRNATETTYGLCRLARNGEARETLVVQSNDDRLKNATMTYPGIVELAEDGETRPGVVVQGNDSRLRKATTKSFGLAILAEAGEELPEKVVQGNDPRLKKATTETEGILRFAKNGEESALSAVQGNDKRLKMAGTETPGIVELAQSGEDKPGKVIQGNDKRLKYASEEEPGILSFARSGLNVPLKAVQANDPRLSDARKALPHTHEYAPLQHEFSSHIGLIRITDKSSSPFKAVIAPPKNYGVIYAKNEAKDGAGLVGLGIDAGVMAYGEETGLMAYSSGLSEKITGGIEAYSRKGFGGVFASARNFAILADGEGSKERELEGSGKAILARGESEHYGSFRVIQSSENDCIARYFKVQQNDVITYGDLLVISEKEGRVVRSKHAYSTGIIGVSVEKGSLEFGKKEDDSFILIALYGVVTVNVDATYGAIQPGDLLVSGLTGGHAIKADVNKLKPGMVIGKALTECKKDRGKILIVLSGV